MAFNKTGERVSGIGVEEAVQMELAQLAREPAMTTAFCTICWSTWHNANACPQRDN